MQRILLFGTARPALEPLIAALAQDGHAVLREALDGDAAAAVGRHRPHLIVIDVPAAADRLDDLCEGLDRLDVPLVAVVTAGWLGRHDLPRAVDDFLVEPIRPAEARVRLRRLLWPEAGGPSGEVIRLGPIAIDHARHRVYLQGRPLVLTLREYDLLSFLARSPGRVYSREALLDRVWGLDYIGGTRTVDVHVRRLRIKLDDEVGLFLQTVRGVGYTLAAADSDAAAERHPDFNRP
jgi:DNA-binding response OmpR family regulator